MPDQPAEQAVQQPVEQAIQAPVQTAPPAPVQTSAEAPVEAPIMASVPPPAETPVQPPVQLPAQPSVASTQQKVPKKRGRKPGQSKVQAKKPRTRKAACNTVTSSSADGNTPYSPPFCFSPMWSTEEDAPCPSSLLKSYFDDDDVFGFAPVTPTSIKTSNFNYKINTSLDIFSDTFLDNQ